MARKGYYRKSAVAVLKHPPEKPMALVAAEHTAQLNAAQVAEVFSRAEEYELLFQDVDLGPDDSGQPRKAIDVLSCTTTMEVGIDIGVLSGVALRNLPPARSNYQQRSGRAGRRGNAVATVIAFGSADSHDEHRAGERHQDGWGTSASAARLHEAGQQRSDAAAALAAVKEEARPPHHAVGPTWPSPWQSLRPGTCRTADSFPARGSTRSGPGRASRHIRALFPSQRMTR